MQKIKFFLSAILVGSLIPAAAYGRESRYSEEHADIKKTALEFEARLQLACEASIRFDMTDFMFFEDELEAYMPMGLEHAQHLVTVIEEACKIRHENKLKLKQVPAIIVKRGSLDDRKMLVDKRKNIIYLAARDGKFPNDDHQKLQRSDLQRLLNIDFTPVVVNTEPTPSAKLDSTVTRDLKVKEAGDWFAVEIKKLTSNPTPDLSERAEKLKKQYEEKLDAALKGN